MTELKEIEDEMRQHPDPVVSVPELAERLDASDTHIRDQLRLLKRAGAVDSKDVGARATAWWHEDRVSPRHVAPEDHPDQSDLSDAAAADDAHSDDMTPLKRRQAEELEKLNEEESADVEDVDELVGDVDVPGYGDDRDDRREALAFAVRHLRDAGPTRGTELQSIVHGNCRTGYETAESFWKNCGQPALRDLRDRGVVALEDEQAGVWAWAGGQA